MKWGGTVISVECKTLPRPYSFIKSFVRRVRIKFSTPDEEQNIPLSIKMSGITIPILLEGRVKVCYKCRQAGHTKSECTMIKCQVCWELGYDDITCTKSRSYANVTSASPNILFTPSNAAQGVNPTSTLTRLIPKIKLCHKCKQPGHVKKKCLLNLHEVIQPNTPLLNDAMDSRFSTPNIIDVDIDVIEDFQTKAQENGQTSKQVINQSEVHVGAPSVIAGDVPNEVQGDARGGISENEENKGQGQVQVDVQGTVQGIKQDVTQGSAHGRVQSLVQGDIQDIDDPNMPRLAANDEDRINNTGNNDHQQQNDQQQMTPIRFNETHDGNKSGRLIRIYNSVPDIEAYKTYKGGRGVFKRPLSDEQHPTCKDIKKQHQPSDPAEPGRDKEDGEL